MIITITIYTLAANGFLACFLLACKVRGQDRMDKKREEEFLGNLNELNNGLSRMLDLVSRIPGI